MKTFSTSPRTLVASLWHHRSLITKMAKREVIGRYRGSMLGILWSFFNPVFMLVIYTFIFSVVFQARWTGGGESRLEFALILFSGLLVYTLFSECINRAPGIILSNANYVKKVVFPLEILPVVALLTSTFHLIISFLVWLLFYMIFFGIPKITIFLFPIVLIPLLLFTLGVSLAIASIGVFLRDVSQIVSVVTTALLFVSPIFFPVSALPAKFQTLIHLNPLTPVIEATREVLIFGNLPSITNWVAQFMVSGIIVWVGYAWFQKLRKGFADVI
jgi:lipopolysaccharide transport system permease protein